MRNSSIVDEDGANEVFSVNLTPKNWAKLCKDKSEGWFARNGEYSLDQLDAEIARLGRLKISYKAMAVTMGVGEDQDGANTGGSKYPVAESDEKKPDLDASNRALQQAFQGVYEAEGELAGDNKKLRASKTGKKVKRGEGGNPAPEGESLAEGSPDEANKKGLQEKKTKSEETLKDRRKKLAAAIGTSQEDQVAYNKATMATMSDSEYAPFRGNPLWKAQYVMK